MPPSKKRIQNRNVSSMHQIVPDPLREWVHIWHGVHVGVSLKPSHEGSDSLHQALHVEQEKMSTAIFHSKSRMEELSFWKQLFCVPSNSLFPIVRTFKNPRRPYKDFLYVLLNMRWPLLFIVLMSVVLGNIILFALLTHTACSDPNTLLKAFNLSYQTFYTIGFGIVYPSTTCSNLLMVFEVFLSMLVTSAITGLVFAKFAKPKAKIAFSNVCVVQPYGEKYLALVVRVANATQSKDVTHDVIMEASFKLNLLRIEPKPVGKNMPQRVLCSYHLPLVQQNFITFRMGIAVVHVINERSPLFGMTDTDLLGSDMMLEVSMSGVDSTLQDTVSERYIYTAQDFRWGYKFTELLEFDEGNAQVVMDFSKLSSIERSWIDIRQYVRPSRENSVTDCSTPESDELVLHDIEMAMLEVDHKADDKRIRRRAKTLQPSNMGMEPLFEPLLQKSVGTQRLRHYHAPPITTGSIQEYRLERNRSINQSSEPNISSPLRRGNSTSTQNWTPHDQGNGGLFDTEVGFLPSEVEQLQRTLSGACDVDRNPRDLVDDDEEDECFEQKEEEERDWVPPLQNNLPRHSAASFVVHNTPRFLQIAPINIPQSYSFMRLYNSALYLRWPKIIGLFILVFLIVNGFFALLYWIKAHQMAVYENISISSFEAAFYLSVHTLSTLGYGSLAPSATDIYINLWALIQSSLGIIMVTIITGISWSKFARPRAHIHFSTHVCITTIYGHRCLVFRAANTRHNGDVHENFFRIGVILTNQNTGLRQLYDVPLVSPEWPSIKLPVTLIHIINQTSPFYAFKTIEDLNQSRVAVIVLLTGLDTTFSENVYARKMYFWDDFIFNARFADFATINQQGVTVDFNQFDQVVSEPMYGMSP